MFNSTIGMIKKYSKLVAIAVAFNLILGLVICLVRGVLTVVEYSNMLLAIGGISSGLGLLSFLGNINSRGNLKQHRARTLIYKDQQTSSDEHLESEKKSVNFLLLAAITGIITILLSGLVLNFR